MEHTGPERRKRLRDQPLSRLFPNLITLGGLCCGLSAIRFAFNERWEIAVGFIVAAALIDGMDGRIARLLGATSTFGAQLDSLSDFLCFGVAPALVLYMWQLHEIRGIGWAVVLLFSVCTALRLARFNTALFDEPKEPWRKQFFTGIPSPSGGGLILLPIFAWLLTDYSFVLPPIVTALYVAFVAIMMASRVPTFAGKNMRIKHDYILPVTIGCAIIVVLFIIEPWIMLTLMGIVYLASIPVAMARFRKLKAQSRPQ